MAMGMGAHVTILDRSLDRLSRVFALIGVAVAALVAVLTVVSIAGRATLSKPTALPKTVELVICEVYTFRKDTSIVSSQIVPSKVWPQH